MGHKSHHSKEKSRGRSKHKHHKSHSRRRSNSSESSYSSSSSNSGYSSSSSESHHSRKRKKHHHHHHEKKNKNMDKKQAEITKNEENKNENEKENKNVLVGPTLPSNLNEINNIPMNNNENVKKIIGPTIPSFLQRENKNDDSSDNQENNDNDSIPLVGPTLPPNNNLEQSSKIIGPLLPSYLNKDNIEEKSKVIGPSLPISYGSTIEKSEESDDDIIGPLPMAPGHELTEEEETQRIINEFEERADRMKRKLEGTDEPEQPKKLVRDEWMTTLPEDNILDRINILKPRQFRKNGIGKIDVSGWTETPSDKLRKQKEGTKNEKEKVEYIQINQKDIEMQKMVEQYNKEHRSESLYDQHAKEYFKNKKYEENDISKLPFNRERDVLGSGSKGSIGKTNQLKGILGIESANRFTHSSSKRFL